MNRAESLKVVCWLVATCQFLPSGFDQCHYIAIDDVILQYAESFTAPLFLLGVACNSDLAARVPTTNIFREQEKGCIFKAKPVRSKFTKVKVLQALLWTDAVGYLCRYTLNQVQVQVMETCILHKSPVIIA